MVAFGCAMRAGSCFSMGGACRLAGVRYGLSSTVGFLVSDTWAFEFCSPSWDSSHYRAVVISLWQLYVVHASLEACLCESLRPMCACVE